MRLAAKRIGAPAGDGPVLVFLHEALGSIGQWKGLPEELAAVSGLPALAYERQGHGRSTPLNLPRPGDYLRHEAEVVLPAMLEANGIAQPLLFGHSDGATIALHFAAAFPERPAACIALAPHEIRRRLSRYHGDNTETLWRAWTETWLAPGFDGCELRAALPRIACPTLVIQGADDAYGSKQQVTLIAEGVFGPIETRLLPGCGHQPHLEERAAVIAATTDFIDRNLR